MCLKKNFYKQHTRTNIEKQSIQSTHVDLWKDLPHHLKDLQNFSFPHLLKRHLLIILDNLKVDHILFFSK